MHTAVQRPARSTSRAGRSDTTIHIRAPRKTKELLETAANLEGKTLSEFTLESASKRAIDVLLEQRLFLLDPEKFAAFNKALDNPPPAGPKLKALMRRNPLWQR
ncbi:MAG TPA: DUF1778 domain-containing protein [Pseudolabrys sp.]|nr:DUF1778 domain-containing protein [Pseudolabrys sp.]